MKLYRTKDGTKLYPCCSWEKNQHKLYNALDNINNAIYDAEEEKASIEEMIRLYDRREEIENALSWFDRYVVDGMVYAPYEQYLLIKDIVWAYNARG